MNDILIFGAGNNAKKIVRYIDKRKNNVLYYVDNDPAKWGRKMMGNVEVIAPSRIIGLKYDFILIASMYWKEIREQLEFLGINPKVIRCPLAHMKINRFQNEYKNIFNVFGKIRFYYEKWYIVEQFHPDLLGIFINPYFFSRKKLFESVKIYSHYMSGKCMDFGCGIQPYKKLLSVSEYVGVEIESNNKVKGIIYYDGHTLPFEGGTFDSIISSEVFEHVSNIEEIVVELKRVLKPGGIMLITVPFVYPEHCWPYDFKRYTMQGLKDLLKKAGFTCIECRTDSNYQECLTQLKNVYWQEDVKARTIIGKFIKHFVIIANNLNGVLTGRLMPYSNKLYLDNVIVVKKCL